MSKRTRTEEKPETPAAAKKADAWEASSFSANAREYRADGKLVALAFPTRRGWAGANIHGAQRVGVEEKDLLAELEAALAESKKPTPTLDEGKLVALATRILGRCGGAQ